MLSSYFYANFFTIGALIPVIFYLFMAFFFLTIKKKTKSSFHLGMGTAFMVIFNLGYFIAASFNHPYAAFHRWLTVGVIMLAETHITMFLFYINDETIQQQKKGKLLLIFQYAVALSVVAYFLYSTFNAPKIFYVNGHYWDFDAETASRTVAYFIELYIIFFVLVMIWKMLKAKDSTRWAILFLGIAYLIEAVVPSITNIMSRNGILDRGTFQITWDMFNILGYTLLATVYINITKDRITFLTKIIGISLISLLLVLQWFSYYSIMDQDKTYDRLKLTQFKLMIENNLPTSDTLYFKKYDMTTKKEELIVQKKDQFPMPQMDYNYTISYINRNEKSEQEILSQFPGYRKIASKRKHDVLAYIHSFNDDLNHLRMKIKALPDKNFDASVKIILQESQGKLKTYTSDIMTSINKSSHQGIKLKKEVLRLLEPLYKPMTRFYRINSRIISVSYIIVKNNIIYEAGFAYNVYRQFFHPNSMKFITLLVVMLIVIAIGFRFIFQITFIKPITTLVEGMSQVKKGYLEVSLPVKNQDELGYITHNFNKMTSYLNDAKDQLEDYASHLEEKVKERTTKLEQTNEELEAAMQELSAINETLIHTNRELEEAQRIASIDMKMAINVQTNFFPKIPPKSSGTGK
jgi:methyl-accepting chemotaxis protein